MPFQPRFKISNRIAQALMRIEGARRSIDFLPITPQLLITLRETARLYSTHYSTLIEGNRLTQEQVVRVVEASEHFPGRERDEGEVLGYYAALERVEQLASSKSGITEKEIQTLHALVMAAGRTRVRPTAYRDGQNVIRDGQSGRIVYMPPEAKDVPQLMQELIAWLAMSEESQVPCPIRAAIAHYQFATIHPYYDGNGRTARLLTTLTLHRGGYDLKGLYSLEEYYARKLGAYYQALTVGPSHNYYLGRAKAEITKWVEYFCDGMAESFESVQRRAAEASGAEDLSQSLRKLDPRQRRALELFRERELITSREIELLFNVSQRTARHLLGQWVESDFVVISDPAKKSRKYGLSPRFREWLR